MKTRTFQIGDETFEVPRCIYRGDNRWRVLIERVGQATLRKSFGDAKGIATGLEAAKRWVGEQAARAPFSGIPLHRQTHRKIALIMRTDRDRKPDGRTPSFSLEFSPSKSSWSRGWMKIFIGTDDTLTQRRIDKALALLAARMARYRIESARASAEIAVDAVDYAELKPLKCHPYRLHFCDALFWTGAATLVSFSPKPIGHADADILRLRAHANETSAPPINAVVRGARRRHHADLCPPLDHRGETSG